MIKKWCATCGHEPSWHTLSRHVPNPCRMEGCPCADYVVQMPLPWCDSCSGPYPDRWLQDQYGGHWDTCPRRPLPDSEREYSEAEVIALAAAGAYAPPPTEDQMKAGVATFTEWFRRRDAGRDAMLREGSQNQRVAAWQRVASHELFKDCHDEDVPLVTAVLARLNDLLDMIKERAEPVEATPPQEEPVVVLLGGVEFTPDQWSAVQEYVFRRSYEAVEASLNRHTQGGEQ